MGSGGGAPPPNTPGTRETRALLDVARRYLLALRGAEAGPIPDPTGLDWDGLLRLAEDHGLLPVLRHVLSASRERVPDAAWERVDALASAKVRGNFRLALELLELVGELQAAGIETVAYKGPALALQAYGDLGLRQFVDLDVLIRERDLTGAMAVLQRRGYRSEHHFTPGQLRSHRRQDGEFPLHHPQTGLLVELHTRVSSRRFVVELETDRLWERQQTLQMGGRALHVLGDEDLLLVLAVHGCKHRWYRLEWLLAVAALLVRSPTLDLERLVVRAERLHGRRPLLLALELVSSLLEVHLPQAVRQAIAHEPEVRELARTTRQALESGASMPTETSGNLRYNLRLMDRPGDRLRYMARWLFLATPEDWLAVPLPDALRAGYLAVRPLRLLAKYGMGRSRKAS